MILSASGCSSLFFATQSLLNKLSDEPTTPIPDSAYQAAPIIIKKRFYFIFYHALPRRNRTEKSPFFLKISIFEA